MKLSSIVVLILLLSAHLHPRQNKRIYINEFLSSNITINSDIVDFDDYSDWIELYNDEDTDVNIGGYFITDNVNQPVKYQFPPEVIIPAKSYLLLWADGHNDVPGKTYRRDYFPYSYYTTKYFHLSFSLSRAGEEIALFDSDTLLVDEVHFNLQEQDISMGRKPDGSSEWFYFGEPTPAEANETAGTRSIILSGDPLVSVNSGFYTSSQLISLSAEAQNYQIKYTLDGSQPGWNSETYTQPIEITKTTVLRVRLYEAGKLPGKIYTYNYFINESTNLAVISLAASPWTLFDEEKGIYDNQFKSREIPVSVQYFESDRSKGFQLDAGLRMTGQASLDYPQKSFTINTDANYGSDIIDYKIFPERNLDAYTELYLRNAGVPDNRLTMFRDGLLQSLVLNKIDVDCQAYIPSALFINGEYWGIYNIREKIGSAYLASLNNINPDDIDLLEFNQSKIPDVVEGQANEFIDLLNYFELNDLSNPSNYDYIKSKIDIDEYINYYITEIYYDNIFWLNQNVRVWKERKEGKKWRWILYDTDNAFGAEGPGTSKYQTNTLQLVTSGVQNNVYPLWSTLTFRKLLENDEFKMQFIQKFSSYINTIFHSDTVSTMISEFQSRISSEMRRHIPRWNFGGIINGLPPIPGHFEWENNVRKMKIFAANRPVYQRQHIINVFNLSGTSSVMVNIDTPGKGKVLVNNIEIVKNNSKGIYFKDIPIALKAVPEVGYRFVKWTGITDEFTNPAEFVLTDSLNITAKFEPVQISIIPSSITENITLLKSGSPYYAQGNITVEPHVELTIENGVRILMPENGSMIISGKLLVRGTKEEPVIIEPNENSNKWGAVCFVNATDSSAIENIILRGATKGVDFTRDKAAISSYNSDLSLDGVVVENVEAPVYIQLGNIAIRNCRLRTESSGDLINIKRANYALTENCDLMGNDAFDSDAIDYDQINSGVIRGNKIYNIYGFNSDGIDLGEDSKNILIENNIIYNVNDKGISIGNASSGIIKRNVIANCDQGVGIKDYGSYGYIEHNTFYANNYAVACFEKNIGEGGGNADVINSILANSKTSSELVDALSRLYISYSMSNTDSLDGLHNIKADPRLLNDLYLSFGSPAVNKGNPALPYDPDGSIADLGAYPFDQYKQINLIINEIHYNPKNGDNNEFIEIVNAGSTEINLDNFSISGDIVFRFGNVNIAPGEHLVLAKDKSVYEGSGYKVFQWHSGELRNFEGNLLLFDDKERLIDFVNYDSRYWWPKEPDGSGPSLELHSTSIENMISFSWRSSVNDNGSPGRSNNSNQLTNVFINEFLASNTSQYSDENGEYDDWIELFNNNNFPVNVAGLYLTDNIQKPGKYQIPFYSAQQTTIPAKGHLLFWADEQGGQGIRHLNFKLEKSGELIALVQVVDGDTLFIDSLTYSGQSENISFGRLPDGSDNWSTFKRPTPLDSNKVITGVHDDEIIPDYSLSQNYPNPFNPTTIIKWQLAKPGQISLKVYDILGREVITLVNEFRSAGKYETEFRADAFSSGIYIYQLRSGSFVQTKKMLLLR